MNRFTNAIFAGGLAIVAGAGTWWIIKSGALADSRQTAGEKPFASGQQQPYTKPLGSPNLAAKAVLRPVPSEHGPHPKVAISGREYKFGTMAVMEKRSHTFVIRNEGEAPLKLDPGTPTCKCTEFTIRNKSLDPGEETEVYLEWVPKSESDHFRQHAPVYTNDPEYYPEPLKLVIEGEVLRYLGILPQGAWNMGAIDEKGSNDTEGTIFSRLYDDFKIINLKKSLDAMEVIPEPMTPAECREEQVKCGYKLVVRLDATRAPIGTFDETINFSIDKDPEKQYTVFVRGRRSGPIQIFPKRGVQWNRKENVLDLGQFTAADGKSGELLMFVAGANGADVGATKIESVDVVPPIISFDVEPTTNWRAKDRKRFEIKISAPPAIKPGAWNKNKPVKVTIHTNHPTLKQIFIDVYFVAS